MATAILPFRKLQAGIETTKGTLVAATRVLVGDIDFDEQQDFYRSAYPRGVRARVGGAGVITRKGSQVNVATDLNAEEVLWPLLCGVKGGVTGVQGGAGELTAYTWTFTPELSGAVPTLNAATLEVVESDGATNHRADEVGYGMCRRFGIEWTPDAVATMSYEFFARARQASTPTGSLTPYSSREPLVGAMSKTYLDTTGAGLGGTQLQALIRSGSFECVTGIEPNFTADGRSDRDFVNHKFAAGIMATLRLTLEFDATGAARAVTDFRDNDVVFIRNLFEGTIITDATTSRHTVRVDGAYRFASNPAISEDGDVVLVDMNLESVYDETWGKTLEFVAINALSAVA